jgi:hypothetical protein
MKKFICSTIILILFGCSSLSDKYEIVKESPFGEEYIMDLKVVLKDRYDEETIKEISKEIIPDFDNYKTVKVYYYTSNEEANNGAAYASCVKEQTKEIEIELFQPDKIDLKVMIMSGNPKSKIIGKWYAPTTNAVLKIYVKEGKSYIRTVYKDLSYGDDLLNEELFNNSLRYVNSKNKDEYYVIESNGNLSEFGVSGKYGEYKSVTNYK